MAKVVFLSVQWMEDSRRTADNLMIAKIMSDIGKPLNPELEFRVESKKYTNFFLEAIKMLFEITHHEDSEDDEREVLLITNDVIRNWLRLREKVLSSSMKDAFIMVQKGLESTLSDTNTYFDCELEGDITSEGLKLTLKGYHSYILYYVFLQKILKFLEDVKAQLQIWEEHYESHFKGTNRNQDYAS